MAISGTHQIKISGTAAVVRVGYMRAATLGAWTVDGDWFVAEVRDVDAFRITQSPLSLEIENRVGAPTIRAITEVTVNRGQLSGRLSHQRSEP